MQRLGALLDEVGLPKTYPPIRILSLVNALFNIYKQCSSLNENEPGVHTFFTQ